MRRVLMATVATAATVWAMAGAASAQTQGSVVEEVVVTGEKAERSLQDTQTSVAVVTARRIEQEGVQTLQEIYNRTANVSETYGSAGFTIRGVANTGVSGGGDSPLTTVYVDGAPLPSSVSFSGPTDSWDVRQVEILRGPQSTLQGLNALAGAVIVRTREPTFDWDLRARAIVADPRETAFAVAGGGPLVEDQLAFRVAAEKRDGEGYIYNITRKTDEAAIDTLNVRGKLLWTPTALPDFKALLSYTHFESEGGYLYNYARTDVAGHDMYDRLATANRSNDSRTDTDLATLDLSYKLSDRLTLSGVTSWSKVDQVLNYDGDNGPVDEAYGGTVYDYKTLTQEVRLNYQGERGHGVIGAFYYDRDQVTTTASRTNVQTPAGTISLVLQSQGVPAANANALAALYVQALPVIPVSYTSNTPNQVTTYAVFGDGEYNLTDRLHLLGGFRWDHEDNDIIINQTAVFVGTYPNPANYGAPGSQLYTIISGINQAVGGFVAQAGASAPPASRTFKAFLPKLGLRYDLTNEINAAFVVQRGYRSGGSSINIARSQVFAYDPEYTWNYEASLRSTWLDGALTLNANVYYVDWTDQQVSVNFGLNTFDYNTVNAGKSHLYGFEVEASHRPSDNFDWYGSVGYSKTKFDDFVTVVGGTTDLSGSEFAYAPEWTLAVGGNYRWGDGFVANLNANYRSEVFTYAGLDQADQTMAARALVNGRIGYETDRWGLYLYGKNLFDKKYMTYTYEGANQAILGDPRVVGVQLQARW